MKKAHYYFTIFIVLIAILSSCKKNVLQSDTKLAPTVLPLQINDPDPILAKDTGSFPLIASTTGAPFTKFIPEHLTNFVGFLGKTQVLVPEGVTVDENGNFSRPVSTVVLRYPVQATVTAGDLLTVKFTFVDEKEKSVSATASKIVVGYKTNSTKKYFYATLPWYSFNKGLSYSKTSIGLDTVKDNLEVFWFIKGAVQYMCSPNADAAASAFLNNPIYDRSQVHNTRFIKINNVQFSDVGDDFLKNMDFTNSVDVIQLDDKTLYGVLLQDGRRAVIYATRYSATISQVISIYQV